MTIAFTDLDYKDFIFDLNDGELINDVLMIVGESGSEELVRGYDSGSITLYGRRSYRINKSIVDNTAPAYATPKAQITEILDRCKDPYPNVEIIVEAKTDTMTANLLGLEISDLVTITQTTMSISAVYYIVESIDLQIAFKDKLSPNVMIITATIGLVQARSDEHP